jgi:hypothetical protein
MDFVPQNCMHGVGLFGQSCPKCVELATDTHCSSRFIEARDAIEAQHGHNDVFPGDPYPVSHEAPRPRSRVLIIGGDRTSVATAVARRLAAAGGMEVVISEDARIDPPELVRYFSEWPDAWPDKEQTAEAPRDRDGHISGLQNGQKHNKKKGKR